MSTDRGNSLGKGTFYLTVASGVLFVVGYIIHFGLARYVGPVEYGLYGLVVSLMTTVNLLLSSGLPQAAAKYIAEDKAEIGPIIKDSKRLQGGLCILLFGLSFVFASIVSGLLNEPKLARYIMLSAFAIPVYAFYSIYEGYLNGLRQFGKQAKAAIGYSVGKLAAVFALVALGLGVGGAILGNAFGAVVGLLLVRKSLGPVNKAENTFGWRKLVGFSFSTSLISVMLFLLLNIDLYAVKFLGGVQAEVGYYTSASNLARLPYFLFGGLAFALLPSISRSVSMNNSSLTKSYIQQSMRYLLLLLTPGILLVSATSADLITLVYSSTYVEAATALRVLMFGVAMITILMVLTYIINGSGKPWVALRIILVLLALDIGLSMFLVPKYGLLGAASATTITGFVGVTITATYVLWRFKTLVRLKSVGRIFLASGVIYGIALQISFPPIWLPLFYVSLFVIYGVILLSMKELGKEDWVVFKRMLPRRD